jgi:3-deoxy-D-manno-octulosonate 8-phosphate phosphatase (KDO 8-P phosphatase)
MPLTPEAAAARARRLRLLLFDVDGVLTDGRVAIAGDGQESKVFSIQDGAAIVWAQREGLQVGWISARPSPVTSLRAAELGVELVAQGAPDKREAYDRIVAGREFTDVQISYMGDDLVDLPLFGRVGLSAAPADAAPEVVARAHWVSRARGGRGAVRDFIEFVLKAHRRWDAVVAHHLG